MTASHMATTRRRLLGTGLVGLAGFAALSPAGALAKLTSAKGAHRLAFHNLHTGERLDAAYRLDGAPIDEARAEINWLLRDHRTGDVKPIEIDLLDLLYALVGVTEATGPIEVISGYRSPQTNAALQKKSSGVARKSFHMRGMAIDIRLPSVNLPHLREAAIALKAGGVGYYPESNFVHVDIGRVRTW